jgi:hypothetical protein
MLRVVQSHPMPLAEGSDCMAQMANKSSLRRGLWFAPRNSLSHGDSGAVGLHHGSHHHARSHHSAGLRACRQRHLAGLCTRDRGRVAGRICIGRYARLSASPGSLYTYASLTLPPMAGRDRSVESSAGLRGHRIKRDRRLLSLRQPVAARCHRPCFLRRIAGHTGHRNFNLDCLSRR